MKISALYMEVERGQAPMGDIEPILMIVAHGAKSSTVTGQSRKEV